MCRGRLLPARRRGPEIRGGRERRAAAGDAVRERGQVLGRGSGGTRAHGGRGIEGVVLRFAGSHHVRAGGGGGGGGDGGRGAGAGAGWRGGDGFRAGGEGVEDGGGECVSEVVCFC